MANRIKGVTDSWIDDGKNGYISGLDAKEFADKIKIALGIEPAVFNRKRKEVMALCSAGIIDRQYFDLIKKTVGKNG